MMTQRLLEDDAEFIMSQMASGEIEINGEIKQVTLTKSREGTKVRVTFLVSASEVGTITRRIIKNTSGQIVWDEQLAKPIQKPDRELFMVIPIESTWKVVVQ